MDKSECIICGQKGIKQKNHIGWEIYNCKNCNLLWIEKYENNNSNNSYIDILTTIDKLRNENSEKIISYIQNKISHTRITTGLEVGSATGIFMRVAEAHGYKMYGIEPMKESYKIACEKGGGTYFNGFFPNDMPDIDPVDFIIFNDVFEHINDSNYVFQSCRKYLKDDGVLILNLPDSKGFLYWCAKILDFLGDSSMLRRLWQIDTDSPHLYYYNKTSILKIARNNDFDLIYSPLRMKTYEKQGLINRVMALPISKIKANLICIGLKIIYPIIGILPPDINCWFFIKKS